MGKSKHVNKARRSIMRQYAGEDCAEISKQCKVYFLRNYMSTVKEHGSFIDMNEEVFNQFMSNVNGYFKCRMKQLRRDYEKETVIKNVKQATVENDDEYASQCTRRKKQSKVTSVLHDMTI